MHLTFRTLPLLLLLCFSMAARGAEPHQSPILRDLDEVKVFFDVNIGEPKKLLLRLQLIDKTREQLASAGIRTQMVIGIRGKATRYATRGGGYVLEEEQADKTEIGRLLILLHERGVRLEQCLIAVDLEAVDQADLLPEIDPVVNGYLSMIGYQSKGFAMVPMD